jgi:NAD(P)-dependent dehydrogenase (short-subunit alcohol dehydrogenase family)
MEQKVWFITGVSRGLGRSIAQAALDRGDVVIGTSRDGKSALTDASGEIHVLALDLTDRDQIFSAIAKAHSLYGRIDVVVNNAGYGLIGAIEETSIEELQHLFSVNFLAAVHVTHAVLPFLRKQRHGHIVNISSIAGFSAPPGAGFYAAAKYALEGMSLSLRQEVAPLGIKVTLVEPGAVRTDFLGERSLRYALRQIADYDTTAGEARRKAPQLSGKQRGDPDRCAAAIRRAVDASEPPVHLFLGSDALRRARLRVEQLTEQLARWQDLSNSTNFPDAFGNGKNNATTRSECGRERRATRERIFGPRGMRTTIGRFG